MRRGVMVALAVMGVVLVVLAVALASVGSNLDQARIERDDLQFEVDDLRQEVDTLTTEREQFQNQLAERAKAADQLKTEPKPAATNQPDEGQSAHIEPPSTAEPDTSSPGAAPTP